MTPTPDELRRIDRDVAIAVFGWRWYRCHYRGDSYCPNSLRTRYEMLSPDAGKSTNDWERVPAEYSPKQEPTADEILAPHYTADPAAAFEVLRRCGERKDLIRIEILTSDKGWHVATWKKNWGISESGPTLEIAICKFALQIFGKPSL